MAKQTLSVFLCYLLRHSPQALSLHMDIHGWVSVDELIDAVNRHGKSALTRCRSTASFERMTKSDINTMMRRIRSRLAKVICLNGSSLSLPQGSPHLLYSMIEK